MSAEKERVDTYLGTIVRLEPDVHMIDAGAFYASAAISLKRIADALEISACNTLKKVRESERDHKEWMIRKGFGDLL